MQFFDQEGFFTVLTCGSTLQAAWLQRQAAEEEEEDDDDDDGDEA